MKLTPTLSARCSSSIVAFIVLTLLAACQGMEQPRSPGLFPSSAAVSPTPFQPQQSTTTFTPVAAMTAETLSTPVPTPVDGEATVIGHTVEGRALEVYRFGNGFRGKLIVAGIHGGYEANTVDLARALIEHVRANPTIVPPHVTLYIIPVLNVDGYHREFGPAGRANANNVDINRNWDANWKSNWSPVECWNKLPITAGSAPGSEPETQFLTDFLFAHQIDGIISYHSAAAEIYAGGVPVESKSEHLAKTIAAASGYRYPPRTTLCEFTGQFIDWAADHGIAAVDVELSNHVDLDWEINLNVLNAFLAWKP